MFGGFLEKFDPAKISDFNKAFLEHIKGTRTELLAAIAKDGNLSEASDKALNKDTSNSLKAPMVAFAYMINGPGDRRRLRLPSQTTALESSTSPGRRVAS